MRALCIAALAALSVQTAHAGAWTRAPGSVYTKVAYGGATAADQFAFDGRRKPYADNVDGASFFDRSMYLYGEMGLARGVALVVGGSFKRVFTTDEAFRYERTGFGDARLGLTFDVERFFGDFMPGALALNVWAEGPTGYVRNTIPAPGQGNLDLAATLDWGTSFGRRAYLQVAAGYRVRTSVYSLSRTLPCQPGAQQGCMAPLSPTLGDEALLRAEVGGEWFPWVFGSIISEAGVSIDAPRIGFSVTQPVPTHRRVVKLGVGGAFRPRPWLALEAQAFTTPWGQNTIASIDAFIGLSSEFALWSAE